MADIPEGAQRSADGYYWWNADEQAWHPVHDGGTAQAQPAATSSSTGAEAAGSHAVARTGTISVAPGVVHEQVVAHDDVIAMVERGGAQLPEHEGAGEAYA